jgi:RNA polymerase sigma-70 factor (ECF subfamily)
MKVEGERALVLRAVAGDRRAFDALAETCRPWLFGLCFQLVRDRHAADDLVQEALVQALRGIARLRDPERFRAWLSRIAVNACRMHLRRMVAGAPGPLMAEHVGVPAQTVEQSPFGVDDALARINPMHRRILMLFYGEGLSHAEVGDLLALSPAAVKSRVHRAREQMRKEMLRMMTPEQKARLGVTKKAPWALRAILLVEPEESVRESLRSGLTAAGYEVIVLPTGEAALAAAAERKAQMLILDKHCGEPNWVEVLTLLQADAWCRDNLPICVLIDPDNQRDRILAWQAGASLCFTRPPSTEEVVGFVKRAERLWSEARRGESEEAHTPEKNRRKSAKDS